MKLRAAALLAVALAGCPAPRPVVRPPPIPLAPAEHHEEAALAGVVHVVQRGETMYRIARAYGIDPADLMETNGIADPRAVAVGTELFVPGATRVVEVPPAPGVGEGGAAPPPAPSPPSAPSPLPSPPARAGGEGRSAAKVATTTSTTTPTSTTTTTTTTTSIRNPAPTPPSPSPSPPARAGGEGIHGNASASTAVIAHGEAALAWPLKGVLYGRYGVRDGRRHDGVDIAAPEGTPVAAAEAGTVIYAGEQAGYGAIVIVRHDGGLVTIYAHNSKLLVKEGARVRRGEPIARVGQTGRTTGPHLHFEVREGTRPRNPLLFLP